MTVGAGVPRTPPPPDDPDHPKHAEPSGETDAILHGEEAQVIRYEVQHVRADGTPYDQPAAKNISEHPLHKINIEVDAEGNEVDGDGPIVKDQYTNLAWRRTWKQSAPQVAWFDLSESDDMLKFNMMLAESEPPTAPRTFIIRTMEHFDKKRGTMRVYVMFRKITYKKILSVT